MSIGSFKSSTSKVSFNSTPEVCNFVREQSSNFISKEISFASKDVLAGKKSDVDLLTNDNLTNEISLATYAHGPTIKHDIAQNITTTTLERANVFESTLVLG